MARLLAFVLPASSLFLAAATDDGAVISEHHTRSSHSLTDTSAKEPEPHDVPPSVFFYDDHAHEELRRPMFAGLDYARLRDRLVQQEPDAGRVLGALQQAEVLLNLVQHLVNTALLVTKWKQFALNGIVHAQWSLRVYPSSGALYPTEVYFLVAGGEALLHVDVKNSALREVATAARPMRPEFGEAKEARGPICPATYGVILSAIPPRQTYKYGERGLRYALLDAGHVLGALEYAGSKAGAELRPAEVPVDVRRDLQGVLLEEVEEAVGMFELGAAGADMPTGDCSLQAVLRRSLRRADMADPPPRAASSHYRDRYLQYPSIASVTSAIRAASPGEHPLALAPTPAYPPAMLQDPLFHQIVWERRTATGFNEHAAAGHPLPRQDFEFLLSQLNDGGRNCIIFIYRAEGYPPGFYYLETARGQQRLPRLHAMFDPVNPLTADQVSILGQNAACGQAVGGKGYFALGILSNPDELLESAQEYYRAHLDAGRVGHRMYLGAEYLRLKNRGEDGGRFQGLDMIRTSGMGCYIDSYFPEALGTNQLPGRPKVLYMVGVGYPSEVK